MKIERLSLHGPAPTRRKDKACGSGDGFAGKIHRIADEIDSAGRFN